MKNDPDHLSSGILSADMSFDLGFADKMFDISIFRIRVCSMSIHRSRTAMFESCAYQSLSLCILGSPLAPGPNAGIVTQKRPSDWNSYGSEDRGTTVQISWTNFIRSCGFSTSRLADAELILRVRAKMIIPEQLGAENDSSMTAPPFFPVAPSTAMILFLFIVMLYAEYLG